MTHSRRAFVGAASATLLTPVNAFASNDAARGDDLSRKVLALFEPLPGKTSLLVWSPAAGNAPELTIRQHPDERMFVGSAFKAFVLCERLRQLDGKDVVAKLQANLLALDQSVWSPGSTMFDPPNLSGKAPERTAAEAMIMHSDNTGTDMMMLATKPAEVRKFIADEGWKNTQIPDSTRIFFGYLLGLPDYLHTTWQQLVDAGKKDTKFVNPPLSSLQTLASTASDMVSFYSKALQGKYFQHPETLTEFRRILTTGDVIARVVPPGASAYAKGGSIDVPGFHALCAAGGMTFSGRWVYFTITLNWDAPALTDPDTVHAWAGATANALKLVYDSLV
jgi:beta-lactamase class A